MHFQVAPVTEHRLVATWSDGGVVSIWDASKHVILLDSPSVGGASGKKPFGHKDKPLFTFTGHQVGEGEREGRRRGGERGRGGGRGGREGAIDNRERERIADLCIKPNSPYP